MVGVLCSDLIFGFFSGVGVEGSALTFVLGLVVVFRCFFAGGGESEGETAGEAESGMDWSAACVSSRLNGGISMSLRVVYRWRENDKMKIASAFAALP